MITFPAIQENRQRGPHEHLKNESLVYKANEVRSYEGKTGFPTGQKEQNGATDLPAPLNSNAFKQLVQPKV